MTISHKLSLLVVGVAVIGVVSAPKPTTTPTPTLKIEEPKEYISFTDEAKDSHDRCVKANPVHHDIYCPSPSSHLEQPTQPAPIRSTMRIVGDETQSCLSDEYFTDCY